MSSTPQPSVSPPIEGTVASGFEPVQDAFAEVVAAQPDSGASLAAWHDGRWVASLYGGWADSARTRPWMADSLVMPYSVTKPFAAVCALMLVDRDLLALDAPMQRYWPQLRAATTVRQVLSHQAGLVVLDDPQPTDLFYDWAAMCAALERQEPCWEPGTAHGESALFFGHLVGELVRRIDGRSLGRFLHEEVCGPRGLDFLIGLHDTAQDRAVDLTGLDDGFRTELTAGRSALYQQAMGNPPGALDPDVVNGTRWRSSQVPAVNGHGTAESVAGFYAALLTGDLLSPTVLAELATSHCSGPDAVMGSNSSWGLGVGADEDGFGMGGTGGSVGWASTQGGYAFAFLTGHVGNHDRADLLEQVLRQCLNLPPLS
jgi:CubicO group peptidase (beta-lactamase class C family)